MRLVEFFSAVREQELLYENAKKRYMQMLEPVKGLLPDTSYETLVNQLKFAMENFEREDRVIWYVRWARLSYFSQYYFNVIEAWNRLQEKLTKANTPKEKLDALMGESANFDTVDHLLQGMPDINPENVDQLIAAISDHVNKLTRFYQKESSRLKKAGYDPDRVIPALRNDRSFVNGITRKLSHYLGMPVSKIQNYTFDNEWPLVVFFKFEDFEEEWREKLGDDVIDISDDPGVEKILEFGDGMAWFNLNRDYCDQEGRAMGHCGNHQATRGENDTVLSLRSPVRDEETATTYWKPYLTFILDTETGKLGEMKGRGNAKPAERYHPYIIELLKQPIIKGIKGGGHAPEKNFSVEDLDEETSEQLIEMKPELASYRYRVKKHSLSQELIDDLIDITSAEDYIPNHGFVIEYYQDIDDVGQEADLNRDMFDGTAFLDYHVPIDSESAGELLNEVLKKDPKYRDALYYHLASEHNKEVVDFLLAYNNAELEPDDGKVPVAELMSEMKSELSEADLAKLLEELGHSLYDEITMSINEGYKMGAENQFHEDFKEWMKNPTDSYSSINAWFVALDPNQVKRMNKFIRNRDGGLEKREVDHYYALVTDPLTIASQADGALGEDAQDSLTSEIEFSRYVGPRYGYDEYDEQAAIDYFMEMDGGPLLDSYVADYRESKSGRRDASD